MSETGSNFRDLVAAEADARGALEQELEKPQRLAHETHLLIGTVVEAIRSREENERNLTAGVCIRLLHRASNDLRCASQLADRGYPAQAATVCTSLFEAALAAAYIANSEQRAREWLGHDRPTSSFRPTKNMIEEVLGRGRPEVTDRVYRVYGDLCMPKHVNPMHESLLGVEARDGTLFLTNGPDCSEFALNTSWFAIVSGCWCVLLTLAQVADVFLDNDQTRALEERFTGLLERCRELKNAAVARWGE